MIPPELAETVERHGRAVAAGENDVVLADFRPDRVGQLLVSARPPEGMHAAEVLRIEPGPGECYSAFIRYTGTSAEAVFRSRWIHRDGRWLVNAVRNVPETPPWTGHETPADGEFDSPHWAGLRVGELRIQHCPACGEWIWAPRPICPVCHHREPEWLAVEPAGTVFAWTRTWQVFDPAVSGHVPYVVVLVELPGAGGRRLLGVLLDGDDADVRIGMPVKGEFEPSPTGGSPLLRWRLA